MIEDSYWAGPYIDELGSNTDKVIAWFETQLRQE